jgi:predicted GTPase
MAKEMGLNPKSLIKNIPNEKQKWKSPVKEWIEDMYEKRKEKSLRKSAGKKPVIESLSEEVNFSLSEIVVSEALSNTRPKEAKIQKVKDYYKEHGTFEKPFVVNKKNLHLMETYGQYIAAKELGLEEVPVRFKL